MDYIHIYGKSFDLTDSIKDYVKKSIDSLKKFNLDITGANVTISADEKNGKKGYVVEFDIHLAKKGNVVVKQKDKDVYAAIDLAINRVNKILRRFSDKIKDHKHVSLEEVMAAPMVEDEIKIALDADYEVVPHNLDIDKPVDIEEAIEYLKNSDKYFIVFEDRSHKIRVLYKRTDGRFGLY